MIDWLFVMFLMLAILFATVSIFHDSGFFWNIIFILISIILFFILAVGIMSIETPYQMYNATSGNIETGYHTYYLIENIWYSYLFYMFAVIMMIYSVAYVYIYIGERDYMKQ